MTAQLNVPAEIDRLITEHNQYIDSVWKGTADITKPPKTGKRLLSLIEQVVAEELRKQAVRHAVIEANLDQEIMVLKATLLKGEKE